MTGFTPEEWRTAARVARRSIFTEGNPDLADAWEKAADQVEARLIPGGGMALTAEQVEDVKIVLNKFGFNQVTPEVVQAIEASKRLTLALFPATEPAEEETKAEGPCMGGGDMHPCVLSAGHAGVHTDSRGLRWNNPASSPVVPATTETGPWMHADEIPNDVTVVIDRDKRTWKYSSRTDKWTHRSHGQTRWVYGYPDPCFAPFVAAPTETGWATVKSDGQQQNPTQSDVGNGKI